MRKIITLVSILLVSCGIGIPLYFLVADAWNNYSQAQVIVKYKETNDELTEEDYELLWEQAKAYNAGIDGSYPYIDVFDGTVITGDEAYQDALDINGDGVIGYISIPTIDIELAIYHGVSNEVLEQGIGHVSQTSLPTGENGESAVLAGHRGLKNARLFTDLDVLEDGDTFYLYILDKVFVYEVDQIMPMVDKDDYETFHDAFAAEEDKNLVTLLTCTPYGVNSHRLLVRGELTDTLSADEAEEIEDSTGKSYNSTLKYVLLTFLAIVGYAVIRKIIAFSVARRKNRKQPENTKESDEADDV